MSYDETGARRAYLGTAQTDPTAPPTYTREIDGEAVTFDVYGNGATAHYAIVGAYPIVESADLVAPCADGGRHGAITYRPNGRTANMVTALPDAIPGGELDRGLVKVGRSKKGATALVVRHGRARRDVASRADDGWFVERRGEADLVRETRRWVLQACEACAAIVAGCETDHGAADHCRDCADGCGCLPPLVGIETVSWEQVIRGGLATDTRRATLDARERRSAARVTAATDRLNSLKVGTKAHKRALGALERAIARHDAMTATIAARRRAMSDESYGLAGRSDCAVAHDSLDGAIMAIVNGAANGAAWRADHGPNETAPHLARRVTGWSPRYRLASPAWRRHETATVRTVGNVAIPNETVTVENLATTRERVWSVGTATVTALPAPRDGASYWHGHTMQRRTATAIEARTQRSIEASERRAADATAPMVVGETRTWETPHGTLRIARNADRYRVTYPDGARRAARTWSAATRLARVAGAVI